MNRLLRHTLAPGAGLVLLASCTDTRTPTGPDGAVEQINAAEVGIASNSWSARTAMPTGRLTLAAAVVNNPQQQPVLYAIGGDDGNGQTLSTVEAYNFATNTWSTRASIPARLEETNGAAVIAGKIYISGGRDLDNASPGSDNGAPRKSLYVYDPIADSWSRKADMPEPSMSGVAGGLNGQLYAMIGGSRNFYRYDPATDTWSPRARCPIVHFRAAAAAINGKLYVAGGEVFGFNGPYAIRKLHVYDPTTDRWTVKAPLPRGVYLAAGARLLGQLYVLGGISGDRGRDLVQAYDPLANMWSQKAPLPTSRVGLAASNWVNLGGRQRIVAIGGSGGLGERNLRSNDVYTP
jgi:N-acetylneuraminic acid mutarotase